MNSASTAPVMLAVQFATLLFVIAGLAFMIGWQRFAKRLMLAAVLVLVTTFVIAANSNAIRGVLTNTPSWVLGPALSRDFWQDKKIVNIRDYLAELMRFELMTLA